MVAPADYSLALYMYGWYTPAGGDYYPDHSQLTKTIDLQLVQGWCYTLRPLFYNQVQ